MLEKILLSTREAAYALGISQRQLFRLSAPNGPLPTVRVGRRVLYRKEDLEAFAKSAARQSTAEDGHDADVEACR